MSYKLQGHTEFQGLKIAIENRRGSVRRGTDENGDKWETKMQNPYGYIQGTLGVDGDAVDCFLGDDKESKKVFIVHIQNPETGEYDEDKVFLGFEDEGIVRNVFLQHYDQYTFLQDITIMEMDEFKTKLQTRKGKMIKGIKLFGRLIKSIPVKDLLSMDLFDLSQPETDVIEGKTVVKNGKTYEYRRSEKNPNVKRLFSTEKKENQFDMFGDYDQLPALTRTKKTDIKADNYDLFDTKPAEKPEVKPQEEKPEVKPQEETKPTETQEEKPKDKDVKLFGKKKKLFSSKKEGTKKETKPDQEDKLEAIQQEINRQNLINELNEKAKENKKDKPKDDSNPLEDFGVEHIDRNVKKKREELNLKVKELLDSKTDEEMTDEDRALLAQYSGRGNLTTAETLDDISLNEFYTRSQEAKFLWDMLSKLGFKGGNVLEPSCGTGMFVHLAPEDTLVTGVEIDPTAGRVANILHGENHDIRVQSFEQFNKEFEGGLYDAVIGNCPFGTRGESIIDDPTKIKIEKHEQYFIDRSLDALKEGGLLAMIVPTGIMDNQINQWRLEMNKKGEFLGSIRIPTGAFKHANAQVTTDMVFFRKRPQAVIDYLENVKKEDLRQLYDDMILDGEFISGNYFKNNPQYTLGIETRGKYENQKIWKGDVTAEDLQAVGDLLKFNEDDYSKIGIDVTRPEPQELHVGDIKVIDGRTYQLNENHRWVRLKDEELNIDTGLSDEVKQGLGIGTLAELQAIQNDVALKLNLDRAKLKLLGDKLLNRELERFSDKNDFRSELLKRAVLLGLEIKTFQRQLQNGELSTTDGQMKAQKLVGLLENFKEVYGHPINDLKLNKYLGKTETDPILYICGAFDKEGKLHKIFDDPNAYYKIYKKTNENTIGDYDKEDLYSVVQYLTDNGYEGSLELISTYYKGGANTEKALLSSEDIFIDEKGNFAPINEVCLGEVYTKLDYWEAQKEKSNARLSDPDLSDDERELEILRAKKYEDQSFELRRRADIKPIEYLPVMMKDAGRVFDIEHLNAYLSERLGADYADRIINVNGIITFEDETYREIYSLYANKGGGNNPDDTSRLNNLLKRYFEGKNNPIMLAVLNAINRLGSKVKGKDAEDINTRVDEITHDFAKYLAGTEDADKIAESYNRLYNNYIQKKYDCSPIEGLSKFDYEKIIATRPDGTEVSARDKAGDHTWSTVRRMYDQGKGMIAHGVGLGKTLEAIILTLLAKETGRAKKPLVVTPKSVLKNWIAEINKWTKDVNFLVVGLKWDEVKGDWVDESRAEKELKLQKLATEEYDMVLMTRDTFSRIDMTTETKKRMIDELVNKYYPDGELSKKAKKKRETAVQNITKVMEMGFDEDGKPRAFQGLYLDSLGIDMIVRDEAHDVKNLLKPVENEISGINASDAQRSLHNFFASKVIRSHNKEKGVFMLTATPISNSPLEVFNMMLPFAEKELGDLDIQNMDQFIDKFAQIGDVITSDPDGRIVTKSKFAGWASEDILRKTFFRFTDYKTKDDVASVKANIKFPKANPSSMVSELNEGQKQLLKHCQKRLWAIKYRRKDEEGNVILSEETMGKAVEEGLLSAEEAQSVKDYFYDEYLPTYTKLNAGRSEDELPIDDVYFSVQSDMIKITSDLDWYKDKTSLFGKQIDGNFAKQYNDLHKFKQITENVLGIYKSGGKQLIFAINTNLHDKLKADLIKAGIPKNEIVIINGKTAKDSGKRLRMAEDYNSGKYKIVIGNYATMGEGLNFNKYTSDIHHLQPAWNYLQIEQGNGRGVRQGNPLDVVNTWSYLTKGTIDGFMNDKIQSKGSMVDKFLRGELSTWDDDVALDGDEMLIQLAENPEQAERLLRSRNERLKKIQEEKDRSSALRKFDQLFDAKAKLTRIEDKTSRRYKMIEQEIKRLTDDLNANDYFEQKEYLGLDKKPIVVADQNVMIPVGSVIRYGYAENEEEDLEYAVIDEYTPTTGRIQLTTFDGNGKSETKTLNYKEFAPQVGKTIEKKDFDVAEMFKKICDKGVCEIGIVSKMPIDAFKANKSTIITNLRKSDNQYEKVMYANMDGNYNVDYAYKVFKDIDENGGKVVFPQDLPDFPKVLKSAIDQSSKDKYSYHNYPADYAKQLYGEGWKKVLDKELKKLSGKDTTFKYIIPRKGAQLVKRINELAGKGLLYNAKETIKDMNSWKEWERRSAMRKYHDALRNEFLKELGITEEYNKKESVNEYINVPKEVTEDMLDRARAIDDLDNDVNEKPIEEILQLKKEEGE